MSLFDKWENRLFEMHSGDSAYEPPEDCPCGCEGDGEVCTAEEDYEADRGMDLADDYEDRDACAYADDRDYYGW